MANWTPSDLSDFATAVVGWWDAADAATITHASGAVSQWSDKSAAGHHLSQGVSAARPSYSATGYNSLPAVSFVNGDNLARSVTGTMPDGTEAHTVVIFAYKSATSGYPAVLDWGNPNTGELRQFGSNGANIGQFFYVIDHDTAISWNAEYRIALFEAAAGASPAAYIAVDGGHNAAKEHSTTLSTLSTVANSTLAIGDPGATMTLHVQEIIVLNRVLSSTEKDYFTGYGAHKWSQAGRLDASHPYKASAPTTGGGASGSLARTLAAATLAASAALAISGSLAGPLAPATLAGAGAGPGAISGSLSRTLAPAGLAAAGAAGTSPGGGLSATLAAASLAATATLGAAPNGPEIWSPVSEASTTWSRVAATPAAWT